MDKWNPYPENKPKKGHILLVDCVVKGGRKRKIMAAKLMEDYEKDIGDFDYWIALKNYCKYTAVTQLQKVYRWKYIDTK